MTDRMVLFNMLYALAAQNGREEALFGSECLPRACEAFARSLAGNGVPELWFEIPLAGEPWFDLHALSSQEDLAFADEFAPETTGGNPEAFSWFAAKEKGVRQLALSWDVGSGPVEHPAIQLLVSDDNVGTTCEFLAAAGRPDAVPAYRSFVERLPKGWFACYAGVFPERPGHNLRVECIPVQGLQKAYADDAGLLEEHLLQTGLHELGGSLVARCQELARTPFKLEFQFDVDERGCADDTFSASLRFAQPPGKDGWQFFDPHGEAGTLMQKVESWGLADGRWSLLADTTFAKRASRKDESSLLYCYPAFVKLRWRGGEPFDAKAYLIAGAQ